MSDIPEQLRQVVSSRAGQRCEYCRLPARTQVGRFAIDHIVPRTQGGQTIAENLALACPHCNGHKWASVEGIDPQTGRAVALFNPRIHTWSMHFRWAGVNFSQIEGLTDIGRATIARLQMNHPDVVLVRTLLGQLDLWTDEARE